MIPIATDQRAHAGDRIARPLTEQAARDLDAVLAIRLGVQLHPTTDFFGVVHLHPSRPLTTREEVRALAVVMAKTDAPLAWTGDVIWSRIEVTP